ncbi:MAG: KpsF/GutQ family sugar-phosphate isomerase [Hyphomicrobiaceae bacterium]|nr:KpsF/GutQ family sugar-phosphate isomerase [Hyphomicrobiaceae bacterium]
MAVSVRDDSTAHSTDEKTSSLLESARRTLELESRGLQALEAALTDGLSGGFAGAVDLIREAPGRVIVSGIGKSGHVAQKVAATLASTGTPAFFVHPSEASHGDLGMITRADVVLAFSWSGETAEFSSLITYSGRFAVPIISVTSRAESTLASASKVALVLPKSKEACPHGLAPTTSTLMQLALGDCLAIALLESKGFSAGDFKVLHPGGQLGASLQFVSDIMHTATEIPITTADTPMSEALVTMTEKSMGCLGIVDDQGRLAGIITDGDLRRHMGPELLAARAGDIMTENPKTVAPDTLASTALEVINSKSITALFVVEDGKPVGLVHIHDLLRSGVA